MSIPTHPIPVARLWLLLLWGGVFAGCAKSGPASATPALRLIYTSAEDQFSSWPHYLPEGGADRAITIGTPAGAPAEIRLTTADASKLGVNKLLPMRRGRIEFEYAVLSPGADPGVFTVFAIPLYNSGLDRYGLIEAGTEVPDDPKSGFSPLRGRFNLPRQPAGTGSWQTGTLAFDFTPIQPTTHLVVGLRINEGVAHPGPGSIAFRNVRVFGE